MTKPDFEQILQFSNHGVIATDKQGRIVFINKRAKEILQFGRKKIIGKKVSDIIKNGLYSNYVTDEVIQTKRPVRQLQYIKNTNKTVLCTGIPFFDRHGKVSF